MAVAIMQYLDPGAGSLVLQALIAVLGGAMASVIVYWRSVRSVIQRLFGRRPRPDGDSGKGQ